MRYNRTCKISGVRGVHHGHPSPLARASGVHKQARSKTEDEVQAFINGTGARNGPPIKADVTYVRGHKSYIATWEHMEQHGFRGFGGYLGTSDASYGPGGVRGLCFHIAGQGYEQGQRPCVPSLEPGDFRRLCAPTSGGRYRLAICTPDLPRR